MRRRQRVTLIAAIAFSLLVSSCRRDVKPSLRDRILSASTSQYCRPPDACFNPHVLAVEDGYYVTTFQGAKPQYVHVPIKKLAKYLLDLPMQAWPRGPSITITPSDDVTDGRAVQENLQAAQQLCRSMGLEVEIGRGG
jgi:hypothetical protein